MGGQKRLIGLRLVVVLQLELLQEQVRSRAHECVRLGGEHWLDMAIGFVQAANQVEHLTGLGNWVTNITQIVS